VDVLEHGRQQRRGGAIAGAQIQHPLGAVVFRQPEQPPELLR